MTVSGKNDPDLRHESVTVSLTGISTADLEYHDKSSSVSVNVIDDDAANLVVDPATMNINETGSGDFSVWLAMQPTAAVTVSVSSGDEGAATVLPGSLDFTTSDWSAGQLVTVSGVGDADRDDESVMVSLSAASADAGYEGKSDSVDVDVTDVPAVTVDFELSSYDVVEGSTVDVAVSLSADPERTVIVPITATGADGATSADFTITPSSVRFNSGETSKTVVFTATSDSVDEDGESVDLTFGDLPSGVSRGSITQITVTITDNNTVGVTIDPTTLTVVEGDADGASYTVTLDTQPSGDVIIVVSGHDSTDLRLSGSALNADDELTFTVDNWDTAQTVTVKAEEDNDATDDADVTLKHDVSSADDAVYDGLADQDVTVSITENDAAGVTISRAMLTVTEGDVVGESYTVRLNTQPSGDVTVAISGHASTDLTLSGPTLSANKLTFTVDTWSAAQTVTVKAAEDDDATDDTNLTLRHAVSAGSASEYLSVVIASAVVTVTDNDAVVTIAADAAPVSEGAFAAFTLTRVGYTSSALTVDVFVSQEGEYISGTAPTSASFGANDATATLSVATLDDSVDEANGSVTAALQAGTGYVVGTDATATATVSITDNDTAGVTISRATLTVVEGDVAGESYTVQAEHPALRGRGRGHQRARQHGPDPLRGHPQRRR